MTPDFQQLDWDKLVEEDCRAIVRLAVREDLYRQQDWTTVALIPADRQGTAEIVAREPGVVAGMPAVAVALDEMQAQITLNPVMADGEVAPAGSTLAELRGNVRDLLTCERILLNLLARLMGIATLARQYVSRVQTTGALVYDTRKTTPGWRRLEKYAARCGGARNHRTGLYDAILIKDNHLHLAHQVDEDSADAPATAVRRTRQFLREYEGEESLGNLLVEVEVDTLEQLAAVLPAKPDIVLLDNMTPVMLCEAVRLRNQQAPQVQLEASGGVRPETIREIAATGVERISVGALTHSARSLDIGLDRRHKK